MTRRIIVVAAVWLGVAAAWFWYRHESGLGTVDAAQQLVDRSSMTANGFESVLLMRLVFLPYDLVNYASGYLNVRRGQFLAEA